MWNEIYFQSTASAEEPLAVNSNETLDVTNANQTSVKSKLNFPADNDSTNTETTKSVVEVLVNPIANTVETFKGIQDLPTAILNEQPPGIILNFTDFFKNNFSKKFLF